jgi:hypothetical protein
MLADAYMSLQRERIRNVNRAKAVEKGLDQPPGYRRELWKDIEERFADLEGLIAKEFPKALELHPVAPWLMAVKGIGPTLACKLIGLIGDATKFETVSKLWRFAGLAVVSKCSKCNHFIPTGLTRCPECGSDAFDGKAERPVRGERLHYDPRLKVTLYNVGVAFLKAGSPYRQVYDEAYAYYMENRPEWSGCRTCKSSVAQCKDPKAHAEPGFRTETQGWNTGHIQRAATRKMVKLFVAHLWEAWYRLEGKAVPRGPYAIDVKGHNGYIPPERFVDFQLPGIVEPSKN